MSLYMRPFNIDDFYQDRSHPQFLRPLDETCYFMCHDPYTYFAFRKGTLRNVIGYDKGYKNAYCLGFPLTVSQDKVDSFTFSCSIKSWGGYSLGPKNHWIIKILKTRYENEIDSAYMSKYGGTGATDGTRFTGWADNNCGQPNAKPVFYPMESIRSKAKGSDCVAFERFSTPSLSGSQTINLDFTFTYDENGGGNLVEPLEVSSDGKPNYFIYIYDEKTNYSNYHSLSTIVSAQLGNYTSIPSEGNYLIVDPQGGFMYSYNDTLTTNPFVLKYYPGLNRYLSNSTEQNANGSWNVYKPFFIEAHGEPWKLGYIFNGWNVYDPIEPISTNCGDVRLITVDDSVKSWTSDQFDQDINSSNPPQTTLSAKYPAGVLNAESDTFDRKVIISNAFPAYMYNSGDFSGIVALEADYTPIKYKVEYYLNFNGDGSDETPYYTQVNPDPKSQHYGTTWLEYDSDFTILALKNSVKAQKPGYDLVGWDTRSNSEDILYSPKYQENDYVGGLSATDEYTVKLYGIWEPKKFTLTVDVDNGYIHYPNNETKNIFINENGNKTTKFTIDFAYDHPRFLGLFDNVTTVTKPDNTKVETVSLYGYKDQSGNPIVGLPWRQGYTFLGWQSYSQAEVRLAEKGTVKGHVYDKPICSECSGSGIVEDELCSTCYGDGYEQNWKRFTPDTIDGYYFDGKNIGDASIKALWEANKYTIKFIDENKYTKIQRDDLTCSYDTIYSIHDPSFKKPIGWKFLGWLCTRNNILYPEDADIFNLSDVDGDIIEFVAQWKSEGSARVYYDKKWNNCYTYVYHNGKWNLAIPYIYHNKKWYPCGGGDASGSGSGSNTANDTSILGYATMGYLTLGKE